MKLIPTLSIAALLAAGSAFAADAPAAANSKPAASAPSKGDHHCRDEANGKKLAGAARKSFIKKCVAEARTAAKP
jgi:hypothetical protein